MASFVQVICGAGSRRVSLRRMFSTCFEENRDQIRDQSRESDRRALDKQTGSWPHTIPAMNANYGMKPRRTSRYRWDT